MTFSHNVAFISVCCVYCVLFIKRIFVRKGSVIDHFWMRINQPTMSATKQRNQLMPALYVMTFSNIRWPRNIHLFSCQYSLYICPEIILHLQKYIFYCHLSSFIYEGIFYGCSANVYTTKITLLWISFVLNTQKQS